MLVKNGANKFVSRRRRLHNDTFYSDSVTFKQVNYYAGILMRHDHPLHDMILSYYQGEQFDACAHGHLLMLSAWEHLNERITLTVHDCQQMNLMALELFVSFTCYFRIYSYLCSEKL